MDCPKTMSENYCDIPKTSQGSLLFVVHHVDPSNTISPCLPAGRWAYGQQLYWFLNAISLGVLTLVLAAGEVHIAGSMSALWGVSHLYLQSTLGLTSCLPSLLQSLSFSRVTPSSTPSLAPTLPIPYVCHIYRNKSQAQLLKGKGRRGITKYYKQFNLRPLGTLGYFLQEYQDFTAGSLIKVFCLLIDKFIYGYIIIKTGKKCVQSNGKWREGLRWLLMSNGVPQRRISHTEVGEVYYSEVLLGDSFPVCSRNRWEEPLDALSIPYSQVRWASELNKRPHYLQ